MPISRTLEYADINWIVQELRALPTQSSRYSDVPDDPVYVESYLKHLLNNGGYGAVCEEQSSFILGAQTRPWYADRVECHELILWVPERYRGGRTAYALIRAFTEYSLDYKPHSIHAGASLDITDAEKTLALYERVGYSRDGSGVILRT